MPSKPLFFAGMFLALCCGSALAQSKTAPTTPPPAFTDILGKPVQPLRFEGRKATVFYFIARECPIANFYSSEIRRLAAEYAPKGVASFVVYVEPDATNAQVRAHYREYAFPCPALHDKNHTLVRRYQASRTPEAVVTGVQGVALYQGRIDDRYLDFGKSKHQPGRADLRLALDAVLAGDPVRVPQTPVIGCPIPEARQ